MLTIERFSFSVNDNDRAAISKLVTRRLTSHSKGPWLVSSKSLMSNCNARSGDANPPKLARWASPHACTRSPLSGCDPRSAAISTAAPR